MHYGARRESRYVMEDGASVRSQQQSQAASNATPVYDVVIPAPDGVTDPLPVLVGHLEENTARWRQMMDWLPSFIHEISGVLYRVNCTREHDAIQGVIDCHVLVARTALIHYGNRAGTYIDLEDNCYPSQRADWGLIPSTIATLMQFPEWGFIHLSRFPAPIGLIDPHTSFATPLYEWGNNIYVKLFGTCELAQAMLCHTDFAHRVADPTYVFTAAYDDNFAGMMTHVLYPSIIQRRTERETATAATPFFSGGIGLWLRNTCFDPTLYTIIDFINAKGAWFSVLFLPVVIIACLTGDPVVSWWCFMVGFIVCWSLGFR